LVSLEVQPASRTPAPRADPPSRSLRREVDMACLQWGVRCRAALAFGGRSWGVRYQVVSFGRPSRRRPRRSDSRNC
jgi:hypothetical protein